MWSLWVWFKFLSELHLEEGGCRAVRMYLQLDSTEDEFVIINC